MKLPTSLKVGYRVIKVLEWEGANERGSDELGLYSSSKGIIKIDTSQSKEDVLNTLIHEILHACYHNGNLQPGDCEERIVTVLANNLSQVIQDNPELKFR